MNIKRFLVCVFTGVALGALGEEIQIEHVQTQHRILTLSPEPPESLWGYFTTAFEEKSPEVFSDKLHPLNTLSYSLRGDGDVVRRMNSRALSGLNRSLQYSAREVFAELVVYEWLKDREDFFANLLRNSVRKFREEELDVTGDSYQPKEHSWWRDIAEDGHFLYGVRPFRTSPYAYVGSRVQVEGETILLANVRYRYDGLSKQEFEFALSIPIQKDFSVQIGTTHHLTKSERSRNGQTSLRIIKEFKFVTLFASAVFGNSVKAFVGVSTFNW